MAKEALTIQLKQSVWLRYYLLLLHGLIFAVTLSLAVDWLWRTGLCLLVLFSFCFYYRSHYLATGRYNARMLMRLSDETWAVDYVDGRQVAGLALQQSVVIPQLVILYFETTSSSRPIRSSLSVFANLGCIVAIPIFSSNNGILCGLL